MKRVILMVLIVVVVVFAALPGIAAAKHKKGHGKGKGPPAAVVYCKQNPDFCRPR